MNRNHIYSLWVFLLCLFPALTCAQTLSRYQYWFDDNFSAKMTKSLSGKEREINVGIDVQQLEDGIHKFSFRVRQSDGMYSAVTSSLFMKTTPGEATLLEYWIDGDMSTSKTIDCQSVSAGGYMVNDYLDLSDVEPGVHRLFLRGRSADSKVVSAITSVPILVKRPMPEGNKVIYWIDDNIDQQESVSFDSSAEVNSLDLDLSDYAKYPVGFHRLNMKLSLEGQGESTILSDGFFKAPTGEATRLEFWLDGDFKNTHKNYAASLSGSNYIFNRTLDLNNLLANVPAGVHRLFIRGRSSDNRVASAVTSVPVLVKRPMPEGNKVIYWIDDNVDQQESVSFDRSTEVNSLDLDLADYAKYPVGFHRLNMKLLLEGLGESAILSDGFFKTPTGAATRMEYWLDGDYKNTHKNFAGTEQNGEYIFNRTLSLSNVTPGAHRLFIRGRSSDNRVASAISSMPIMVKSRYNEELISTNPTMNAFSFSVDNETPVLVKVSQKKDELILNPYTLDVRSLSVGNHTLKAHFWNSANAGLALQQSFKVNAIETPSIQLTAIEKDGQVTLKANSIPNDTRWGIIRTDANGAKARVGGESKSRYPSTITSTDNPPAGTYTYMARSYYKDADGTIHSVNSNEVEITVTPSPNNAFGKIIGHIRVGNMPLWGEVWKVTFSDGFETESDRNGLYHRENIPAGTVLDITVQTRNYNSATKTVTIKAGENMVQHEGVFDEEGYLSHFTHNLQFDSNVEFAPRLHMKFKVKNITRVPWDGRLRIATARKEYVDNPPANPFESNESNDAQVLAGSVASFVVNDYYQYDYSDPIHISPGESKEVFIRHNVPVTTPPTGKDELYYFFVESVDEYGTKLVAINDDYNIKENPLVQLVDCGVDASAEDDIEMCVNLIMGMCSGLPELDGKLGDMSKCMDEMQETLGYALAYDDLAGVIERSGSYIYIRDAIPEWKFYRILYNEDRRFLGMVNAVRDKISDAVRLSKNALQYTKKAKACLDAVKSYNQWQDMTDLERAGSIADKILSMSESSFPFAKILKTYLDVTKASVRNILNLGNKWDSNHDYMTFRDDDILFDIKVKKNTWITTTFDAENVKDQILYAEVKAIAETYTGGNIECTSTYEPTVADGKVRLHRVSANGPQPEAGAVLPIKDMWMTVWWANGRVSTVPIRNSSKMEGNGVKYERDHYTVTFQSETCKKDYMADIIHLDD